MFESYHENFSIEIAKSLNQLDVLSCLVTEYYHVYYRCYIMFKICSKILKVKNTDKLELHLCIYSSFKS